MSYHVCCKCGVITDDISVTFKIENNQFVTDKIYCHDCADKVALEEKKSKKIPELND